VIRVERADLPAGLRALAYRDHDGSLVICVSEALDPASQRAAVIEAIRAARRVGWRAGLPLAGVAMILAIRAMWPVLSARPAGTALLRRAGGALRARPAAWGAAAAATAAAAAAGAFFLVTSPNPGHPLAIQPGAALPAVPKGRQAERPASPDHSGGAPGRGQQSPPPAGRVTQRPAPAEQNAEPSPSPASSGNHPAPTPSSSPVPTTAPSAQPSPPAGDRGLCIHLLGTTVCLRL
jgi:hypothetical protein